MTVWTKTGNSTWTKINSVFNKTGATTWTELLGVWVKTAASTWTRVFTRVSVPANTVAPAITGSQYLYGTLSGTLGTWTAPNGTNSYARQWQSAANSGGTAGSYGNISGATSSTYSTTINENGRWVRLRVTATNLSGSSEAFSNEVLITKYSTVALTIPVISGSATVNSTLTALTTVGTYWKNTTTISGDTAPDSFSYRWYWGDTGQNIGSDSSTYLVDSNDIGHTIRVEVTATNTGGSASSTSDATSTVGQALQISGVNFKDINGNSGLNNRGNVVTATYTQLGWSVTGVDSGTSFRFRYRILNTQTGAYYNPNNPSVTASASAAWASYSDTYYTLGSNLSGSISGSTATISKSFSLNSTFNGSTYSGGIVRWEFDYELSVTDSSGTRYYWYLGDSMSTTQTNDYYLIDPTSEGTITASPTSGGTSTSITLSGTLNSYPSSLTSYPAAYRVVYGDGTNSGWQYQSYGVSNPTYSVSHTYSSIGTYYPYIETIPSYSTPTATVTIADVLTAPTISNVTAGNSNSQPVTVYFSGGSGPYYQMWWWSNSYAPPTGNTPDAYGASSPLTDSSGPGTAGTYYAFVRSVAVNNGSTTGGATVPSSTFSDWSSGFSFTVTQAPIIPTISGLNATSITTSSATISWSSTNQATYSISGGPVFLTGTTATSVSLGGLSSSTFYNITVTVFSSTSDSASASVGFTTSAPTPTPNISSIALRNGGGSTASPNSPRMSATITSSNAASISYILYTGTTTATGTVAASGTVSTSGSVTITTNVGAFNNYYEIFATPYSGAGASGISGTTRYAGTKRNTTTASTTTTSY
jgi:hypothetical protein